MEDHAIILISGNAVEAERLPIVRFGPRGVPNRWVRLDESWAKRLGVQRTSGVYRIRSHELIRRLAASVHPTEAHDGTGASIEEIAGPRTAEASTIPVPRRKAG